MKITDMFPSKYLSGSDLRGPVTVTIAGIEKQSVYRPGEGDTEIFVLFCERASKGVILNKTLAGQIAAALGSEETSDWAGRQVVLYSQRIKVAGEYKDAIRARAVAEKQPAGKTNGSDPG